MKFTLPKPIQLTRKLTTLAIGLALLSSVCLVNAAPQSKAGAKPKTGKAAKKTATKQALPMSNEFKPKPAPDFTLKDMEGKEVKLSALKGKVVLLDFWATYCTPCRFTIPALNKLQEKYKDQGLVVIGISLDDEGWDLVKPYVEQMKMNYTIVVGNEKIMEDYSDIVALPTAYIIDRQGIIRVRHEGLTGINSYEEEVKKLL